MAKSRLKSLIITRIPDSLQKRFTTNNISPYKGKINFSSNSGPGSSISPPAGGREGVQVAPAPLGGAEPRHWDSPGSTDGWSWAGAAPPVRHWRHCPGSEGGTAGTESPEPRGPCSSPWAGDGRAGDSPSPGHRPCPRKPRPAPAPPEPREGAGGTWGQGRARHVMTTDSQKASTRYYYCLIQPHIKLKQQQQFLSRDLN